MKISVKNIDEKPGFYSTRMLKIKVGGKTIETPYRALTHQELNAKNAIPEDVLLYSPFSVIYRKLTITDVEKVLWNNKFLNSLIKFLEEYKRRMQHFEFVLPILQPYKSVIEQLDLSAKEKYLRITTRVQAEAELDFISVPWLNIPIKDYLRIVESFLHKYDNWTIPIIDIGIDPKELEPILRYFKDKSTTGELNFIGIIYKPMREALASYDLAWEMLKNSDLCILLLDVKRLDENLNSISNIHFSEFILGDVISLETIGRFGKRKDEGTKTKRKSQSRKKPIEEKLRFFNQRDLRVPVLREIMYSGNWMDEITKYFDRSKEVRNILQNYKEAEEDKEKVKVLKAISKVHEFLASENEIEVSQKFISKGEAEEYIKEKRTLLRALRSVKGQIHF